MRMLPMIKLLPSTAKRKPYMCLLISICVITFCVYTLLYKRLLSPPGQYSDKEVDEETQQKLQSGPCSLPKLKPYDPSIKQFLKPLHKIDCTARHHPLVFRTDFKSNLIIVQDPKNVGYENCCYTPFKRTDDSGETYSRSCYPLQEKSTKIPADHEFIAVYCHDTRSISWFYWFNWLFNRKTIVDMFHFIHLKENVEQRIEDRLNENQGRTNVVIFGLDSESHMNFLRTMPRSVNYLTNNLSAIGMDGYAIFEENTFANVIPMMTGLSTNELQKSCWPSKSSYFDDCAYLWSNFSSKGYATSYAEDDVQIGIFLYQKLGFKYPPADYYMVPLTRAFRNAGLTHRGAGPENLDVCYGPRLGFALLLENVKKMAAAMGHKKRYFQFTWATSLFHEDHNYAGAGDELLFDLLQWLSHGDYLENTVFMIMSDHGARFGGLRQTEQGSMEARMPFLYILLPKWFQDKYGRAVTNLKLNKDKLTTPLDVYEALKDLLDLNRIETEQIEQREQDLENLINSTKIPQGISLFLPIPNGTNRSCKDAGIDLHSCACTPPKTIPSDSPDALASANGAIGFINKLLSKHSSCAKLRLDHVIHAYEVYSSTRLSSTTNVLYDQNTSLIIILTFKTLPNDAIFEATTVQLKSKEWLLSGQISRINKYGSQSHCISDYRAKPYCYCT